jgi:hypothetical protein
MQNPNTVRRVKNAIARQVALQVAGRLQESEVEFVGKQLEALDEAQRSLRETIQSIVSRVL